jgi:hypothetical protein
MALAPRWPVSGVRRRFHVRERARERPWQTTR